MKKFKMKTYWKLKEKLKGLNNQNNFFTEQLTTFLYNTEFFIIKYSNY